MTEHLTKLDLDQAQLLAALTAALTAEHHWSALECEASRAVCSTLTELRDFARLQSRRMEELATRIEDHGCGVDLADVQPAGADVDRRCAHVASLREALRLIRNARTQAAGATVGGVAQGWAPAVDGPGR